MTDLSALEKAAREATPGPWNYCGGDIDGPDHRTVLEMSCEGQLKEEDARHMAACSPDVILALIKELREARLQRDMARQAFGDALVEMGNRGSRFMDMVRNSKL